MHDSSPLLHGDLPRRKQPVSTEINVREQHLGFSENCLDTRKRPTSSGPRMFEVEVLPVFDLEFCHFHGELQHPASSAVSNRVCSIRFRGVFLSSAALQTRKQGAWGSQTYHRGLFLSHLCPELALGILREKVLTREKVKSAVPLEPVPF